MPEPAKPAQIKSETIDPVPANPVQIESEPAQIESEPAHIESEIDQYDYELPRELIAQQPLANRSEARMLVANRATQQIEHLHVRDFPDLLTSGDTLVLNNTKVVPARLLGRRTQTGGHWEGLFLERISDSQWHIMGSTRGKLLPGETVTLLSRTDEDDIQIRFDDKQSDGTWHVSLITDEPITPQTWLAILDRTGRVPIPPYIRDGKMEESDVSNYQTVFAQVPGAVAAPTAGLHFTPELLDQVRSKGVAIEYVTLHVGIGTFRPIAVEKLSDHVMHHEFAIADETTVAAINARRNAGGRTFAIGTTCVRTLESAALPGTLQPFTGQTNLFIKPPFEFHAVDCMLTNFHLPKSSLLVLIRTFGGDPLMIEAYRQAIENRYRFYSYGDCMVIL